MPVAGRTREQIEIAVGYNLGAIYVSSASTVGSTTNLPDNTLVGGDDTFNGKWILATSGGNDGEITRVSDYVESSTQSTLSPALSTVVPSGMTYQMWDVKYPPAMIHDMINQTILDAYNAVYDPEEDVSLAGDGRSARYDLPSQFAMVHKIEYRDNVTVTRIHALGSLFDETTHASITQSLDTEDKKQGGQSLKLVIAAGATTNALITDSITSLDISRYTHLEFWAKANIAVAAADFHILLDDTVGAGSPLETLAVPAMVADTWTYHRIALANPEDDTAIISVGIRYTVDIGACTVWADDMKVVDSNTGNWFRIPKHLWSIDGQARDLILKEEAIGDTSGKLIKISGGDLPTLLTAESTVNEIDDEYVIAQATYLALMTVADGTREHALKVQMWRERAQAARSSFPLLQDVRRVG